MIADSRRREGTSDGLDPFAIEPTALSVHELSWLAERWPLDPAADGPLGFLRSASRSRDGEERRRTEEGLRAKGLLRRRQDVVPIWALERTVARGSLLRRSLSILERPEARIRIGLAQPDAPPRQVQLFVAGDEAALGFRRGECFFVGPPITLVALATALFRSLESEPLSGAALGDDGGGDAEPAAGMWPGAFDLAAALWPSGSPQPLRALRRSRALASLAAGEGGDAERAKALLDSLLAAGIVRQERGGIAPASRYRPWLEALLSGHRVEIEYTPLSAAADHRRGDADRLLFAGPAGDRVLCGYLDRSLLVAEGDFPGVASLGAHWPDPEEAESFLFMTRLGERPLAVRLRELLRL